MSARKDELVEITVSDYVIQVHVDEKDEPTQLPRIVYRPTSFTFPAVPIGGMVYAGHYLKFNSPQSKYFGLLAGCGVFTVNQFLNSFLAKDKPVFGVERKR